MESPLESLACVRKFNETSLAGFVAYMKEKNTSCVMCREENDLKKQQIRKRFLRSMDYEKV